MDESRQDTASTTGAPPGRASRWVFGAVGLIVIGGAVWLLRGHGKQASSPAAGASSAGPGDRVVPILEAKAQTKDVPIWLEGLGNATPLYTVTVKSQVDGRLDRVLFKEGDAVKSGQVLAQVDPRPFTIALHNAQAALARDQATVRNAKLNLDRYKTLVEQHLIPQQQVDDQQTAADTAAAALQSDQSQIDSARLQLDYAQIKSPIDGVTGVRLVDPGNVIHASDPGGIVVVTQLDPMAVLFTLPEDDLPRIQRELAPSPDGGAPRPIDVEMWSRDGAIKLADGKLTVVDNQVNTQTATIRLKAIAPNPQRALWPNEFVKARLHLSTRKGVLVVPSTAIQRGPQGTYVYVVGNDDTVALRPVDVDLTQGDTTIVAKGIKDGDRVVTDGQNQLRPGAKVASRPPAGGAPSASPSGSPSAAPSGSAAKPATSAGQ